MLMEGESYDLLHIIARDISLAMAYHITKCFTCGINIIKCEVLFHLQRPIKPKDMFPTIKLSPSLIRRSL